MGVRKTKAEQEDVPKVPEAPSRFSAAVGRAYERFLELPVAFVLAVMWLVGAALLGSIALVLYMTGVLLVRVLVGSI